MENLDSISAILKNISIIITTIIAVIGYTKWKKETRWKKKFEIGAEAMTTLFQVRDAIEEIRTPFYLKGEGSSRLVNEKETPLKTRRKNLEFVGYERYKRNEFVFLSLQEKKYQFASIYGAEYLKEFEKVDKIVRELLTAFMVVHSEDFDSDKYYHDEDYKKELIKLRADSRSTLLPTEGDEIKVKIQEVIDSIDTATEKVLLNK